MLKSLHVRQFAIIDDLELEFRPGFTVITGETGAGKSILVDALSLIFGQRADVTQVRHGAKRAEIIAEFELGAAPGAAHWIEEQELDSDSQCIIRRTINAGGGSRAYINGSPVTLQQLQKLANFMIDLHGQHEQQRLLDGNQRLQLVDQALVGNRPAASKQYTKVVKAAEQYQHLQQQLDRLNRDGQQHDQQAAELLRYQLQELDQVEEWFEHQQEWQQQLVQLENSEHLKQACAEAIEYLAADQQGVMKLLQRSRQVLSASPMEVPEFQEIIQMLDEALINVEESHAGLQRYADQVEHDPQALQDIDGKLSKLHELARKHQILPEQLAEHHRQLRARLQRVGQSDSDRVRLNEQLGEAIEGYHIAANKLHEQRKSYASTLSQEATQWLQQLGMADARLLINVEYQADATPNARGNDRITIEFAGNPGQPLRSMTKVASGGELSRIGLALMVASQSDDALPAMIFDEVDAGIGGATASTVGNLLAKLSAGKQAFCVTHMAQVAAFADNHLQVNKHSKNDQTTTEHQYLEQSQRVDEMARMLSGKLTDSSREHAIELLKDAGQLITS